MAKNLVDAAQGFLLGTMVGDAMGMPVKGWPWRRIASTYGMLRGFVPGRLPAGTFTDETEMTLAVTEGLVAGGGFSADVVAHALAGRFTLWRGYDTRTCNFISKVRSGQPWNLGGESWTNGPAVRCGPIGLLYCGAEDLKEMAEACCRITDDHPNALAGAVVQAVAMAETVRLGVIDMRVDRAAFVELLVATSSEYGDALSRGLERLADVSLSGDLESRSRRLAQVFPMDSSAVGSVPAALAAFLSADGFEEAVAIAVNAGGDTDSIGALTGALAGAYYGASAIAEDLLDGLNPDDEGRQLADMLGHGLADLARKGAAGFLDMGDGEDGK
ncbi:MAG: ADP-ribosylglycohydrolase family protein [Deltaproteobacteria bacterium]|nr:ADP-ribosylglycohydrolase family protein [Deltaproteobacteria bacterium]